MSDYQASKGGEKGSISPCEIGSCWSTSVYQRDEITTASGRREASFPKKQALPLAAAISLTGKFEITRVDLGLFRSA
jgi:hypothetical protein